MEFRVPGVLESNSDLETMRRAVPLHPTDYNYADLTVKQAFRREANESPERSFRLAGLDPGTSYRVHNLDEETAVLLSGRDLMEKGLTIRLADRPAAAVVCYEEANPSARSGAE